MNNPVKRLRLLLLLLLMALALSGCGIKFLYNQLDWIIPWYIDDYVALDDRQEALLDQRLSKYLSTHRKQQLPVYARFFHDIANSIEDGLTDQEVIHIFNTTEQFRSDIFASIPLSFSDMFRGLTDAQVVEIERNLDEDLQDLKQRFLEMDPQQQRSIRAEEMTEFLERWMGELSDSQIRMIDQWSLRFDLIGAEFIQSRTVWQQRLLHLLHKRRQLEDFDQHMHHLFSDRYQGRSVAHQQKFDRNKALLRQLYLDIDRTLDSYQRQQLVNNIRDYADDFEALSRQ